MSNIKLKIRKRHKNYDDTRARKIDVFMGNAFAPLWRHKKVICPSGRVSGKSKACAYELVESMYSNQDCDGVMCFDLTSAIKDTFTEEVIVILKQWNLLEQWEISADRSIFKNLITGQVIKTLALANVSLQDSNRSRGFKTQKPICYVVIDEAQKIKSESIIDNAILTLERQLHKNGKIRIMLNPDGCQYWVEQWIIEKEKEGTWFIFKTSYMDIWRWLNKSARNTILKMKVNNPRKHALLMMGDLSLANELSVMTDWGNCNEIVERPNKQLEAIVIGVDVGLRDAFVCQSALYCKDLTTYLAECCKWDYSMTGQGISGIECAKLLINFLNWLDKFYGCSQNRIPIYISVDSAGLEFIRNLRMLISQLSSETHKWKSVLQGIYSFVKDSKVYNLELLNTLFHEGLIKIIEDSKMPLEYRNSRVAVDFKNLRWKIVADHKVLDANVPNDYSDAAEYACIPIYRNPFKIVRFHDAKRKAENINLEIKGA